MDGGVGWERRGGGGWEGGGAHALGPLNSSVAFGNHSVGGRLTAECAWHVRKFWMIAGVGEKSAG